MSTPAYLTLEEVAARYRGQVSEGTLRNWRTMRIGPSYIKIGKAVLYPVQRARSLGQIKSGGLQTLSILVAGGMCSGMLNRVIATGFQCSHDKIYSDSRFGIRDQAGQSSIMKILP
ncbi:hypothetical protein MES5069_130100 [Mesorhizobium escarrei]|uniref:DNA-binding protein n=1 Tax=Mesorhizobium escarrei TaxID=666018 RepID=A0ABM9DHX5_9HYPH|nr:hypothetical protein MES5069_130100 [Mesorhizobium escarrei]